MNKAVRSHTVQSEPPTCSPWLKPFVFGGKPRDEEPVHLVCVIVVACCDEEISTDVPNTSSTTVKWK